MEGLIKTIHTVLKISRVYARVQAWSGAGRLNNVTREAQSLKYEGRRRRRRRIR